MGDPYTYICIYIYTHMSIYRNVPIFLPHLKTAGGGLGLCFNWSARRPEVHGRGRPRHRVATALHAVSEDDMKALSAGAKCPVVGSVMAPKNMGTMGTIWLWVKTKRSPFGEHQNRWDGKWVFIQIWHHRFWPMAIWCCEFLTELNDFVKGQMLGFRFHTCYTWWIIPRISLAAASYHSSYFSGWILLDCSTYNL